MASDDYLEFVLEQLAGAGEVAARKMFGGVGLYLEGVFFALIADDVLYFKVDATNRSDYEAKGMGPFRPYKEKKTTMPYYEVPIEVLENGDTLKDWADKALAVAKSKKK
jgi:DNA transformation protein